MSEDLVAQSFPRESRAVRAVVEVECGESVESLLGVERVCLEVEGFLFAAYPGGSRALDAQAHPGKHHAVSFEIYRDVLSGFFAFE